jgi:3-oxoacyl-[acyl-carrier-protein] synthase II
MRRVVVTGIGIVSPLGADISSTWNALIASQSGISKITHFDTSDLPCKIAGLVHESTDDSSGFNAEKYISPKEIRRNDKFLIYGMGAAVQAVEDSGWIPTLEEDLEATGVLIGSGIGGLATIEESAILVKEEGAKRLSPFFIPSSLINLLSGHVSMRYNFKGPNLSVVTACSTGAHAIGEAARIIQCGDADVILAGGAEGSICRLGVAGFASAKTLATSFNDCPEKASRPWSNTREGFVMGDGAGMLVLEEYEHAKKRGAKIYAEVVGYGVTGDAYHITAPHPEGLGAYRTMKMALRKAKLNSSDIDYINAHGTSTPVGDGIELKAVQRCFADSLDKVCMSSTKSATGHLLGAAGSVEAIFGVLALKYGIVPPTLNLDDPMDGIEIDLVPHTAKEKKLRTVMTNSFGFGGTNASLILQAVD